MYVQFRKRPAKKKAEAEPKKPAAKPKRGRGRPRKTDK